MLLFFKNQTCKQPLSGIEMFDAGAGEKSPSLARNTCEPRAPSARNVLAAKCAALVGRKADRTVRWAIRAGGALSATRNWTAGSSRAFIGGCVMGRGTSPCDGGLVMRKELKAALRAIDAVLADDSRVNYGQRDQLRTVKRELRAQGRSGKLNKRKLFLAVQKLSTVLLEIVES